jgi:hypothetical protein
VATAALWSFVPPRPEIPLHPFYTPGPCIGESRSVIHPPSDRGYISPYFITNADKMRVEMEDPYILIYEKKLAALLPLLEAVVQAGKPLRHHATGHSHVTRSRVDLWSIGPIRT